MSFFSKMASAASSAASATVNAAVSVKNHMVSVPATITCSNPQCKLILAVPNDLFAWTCEEGHSNVSYDKRCSTEKCTKTRELPAQPEIRCGVCSTVTTVPTNNTTNFFRTVSTTTKEAGKATVDFTKNKYTELKSRPTNMTCEVIGCKEIIAVPPALWDWTCKAGHANSGDNVTCVAEDCEEGPDPAQATPKVIKCTKCDADIKVPETVAVANAYGAVRVTKEVATTTVDKTKEAYTWSTSSPVEFNCETCNTRLTAPPAIEWMCEIPNCNTQNPPDVDSCQQCKKRRVRQVRCGKCQGVTTIPSTNLSNKMRATSLSVKSGIQTTKKVAKVANDNKEDIAAAAKFASDNPELVKAAAGAANAANANGGAGGAAK